MKSSKEKTTPTSTKTSRKSPGKKVVSSKELDEEVRKLFALVDGSYVCLNCGKMFQRKDHVSNHCETHLGYTNTCRKCKAEFKSRFALKLHNQKHKKQKDEE